MGQPTFAEFEVRVRAAGFDEVLERRWAPGTVIATHTPAFDVDALVTQGEMWLSCEGRTQHLLPSDRFTLARDQLHDERHGHAGATYWVARRS